MRRGTHYFLKLSTFSAFSTVAQSFLSLIAHTGALVLVCYGIIPTLQPDGAGFARVYAVYGECILCRACSSCTFLDGVCVCV